MSLSVILLGYFLKRIGFLEADHSRLLSKIVMNITFPAQILVTISTAPLRAELFILPWIPFFTAILGFTLGLMLFRKLPSDTKGLMLMATMGLNIGLFAFPILQGLFGDLGVQVASMVDLGNAFVIFGLAYMVGDHYSPDGSKHKRGILGTVKVFVKSVPLMTYAVAIAINLAGWALPAHLASWLGIMGRANQFLVLLVLGLVLSFDWRHHMKSGLIPLILLRYTLGISMGLLVWFFLPVDILIRKITFLCLILPTGFAIVPYSLEFGYDRDSAGAVMNITLIISFFLMWGFAIIL
jgi:malate permease and related proteins